MIPFSLDLQSSLLDFRAATCSSASSLPPCSLWGWAWSPNHGSSGAEQCALSCTHLAFMHLNSPPVRVTSHHIMVFLCIKDKVMLLRCVAQNRQKRQASVQFSNTNILQSLYQDLETQQGRC